MPAPLKKVMTKMSQIIDILLENEKKPQTYKCSNMKTHGDNVVLYDAQLVEVSNKELAVLLDTPIYSTLRFNISRLVWWGRRAGEDDGQVG